MAFALRVVAVPQSGTGALRIVVTDETGLPVAAAVHLRSDANRVHRDLETDDAGVSIARDLPFGAYDLVVERDGFAPFSQVIEIRSALRTECRVTLAVAPVRTEVSVGGSDTLLDLGGTSTASRIGAQAIQSRMAAPPGRALPALVNTQPGWLLEANGILHPRGSEYQTQFVVDGLPLSDNRSPSFAPEIDADEVHALKILTAG